MLDAAHASATLADWLHAHPRVFVLTGAGCSTASGIPDYRDRDGAWKRKPPVTYQAFLHEPATRARYWARSHAGWPMVARARPNAAHHALVDAVTELANARGVTPAQLALAWLLHRGDDIVPIPGTRKPSRLDENAAAARIQLDAAELQRIDDVLATHAVAGTRYPAAGMNSVNA